MRHARSATMTKFLLVLFAVAMCASAAADDNSPPLADVLKGLRLIVDRCHRNANTTNVTFDFYEACFRNATLRALEKCTALAKVDLPLGLRFVKDNLSLGFDLSENRSFLKTNGCYDWKQRALDKIALFFKTHHLQIPLPQFKDFQIDGRRRHHRRGGGVMALILFGVMAMAIIAIPMGFQFLAVLGGKALLLAKLALILTSIQGLKKVATSDISYGLYHSQSQHQGSRPWLYDRRWQQHTGLDRPGYEGYSPTYDQHENILDTLRPKIMMPRIGGYVQPQQQQD